MAFEFQVSSPLDNITLNVAIKKTDQSLSELQTGIGAGAHDTLDAGQLISHTRTALTQLLPLYKVLMERLFWFQKCMNDLQRFMSFWTMLCPEWLGSTPIILAYLFKFYFQAAL